jgi:hypothetical protein
LCIFEDGSFVGGRGDVVEEQREWKLMDSGAYAYMQYAIRL